MQLEAGDEVRFLKVLATIKKQQADGRTETEQWSFCNNTIQGGDCYGETFCDDYSCSHKIMRCACGYIWCGCCFAKQHKYTYCPDCNAEPVEGEVTVSQFYGMDSSDDDDATAKDKPSESDGAAAAEGA